MTSKKMIKVGFFTTTRADFGIISRLIRKIDDSQDMDYCLFVGGTHLTDDHGNTMQEIKELALKITATFDYLQNEDNSYALAKSAGIATSELATIFNEFEFDHVCILGDRFELLAVAINAIIFKKPI